MEKISKTVVGITLSLLGLTVVAGWCLQVPMMVQFGVGLVPMQFNTAICFLLTGSAFAIPSVAGKTLLVFQTVIGGTLIALCSLILVQVAFGLNLGIDWPSLHIWIKDGNISPGRMAPNTAVGFLLIGFALLQIPRVSTKKQARYTQLLTFGVLIVGLTGLVGYVLGPDLLFGWARSARMAVHTAIGMILAGIALWVNWSHSEWYRTSLYFESDEKISFIGSAIIIVAVVTAGLGGFVTLEMLLKKAIHERLQSTLHRHKQMFMDATETAAANAGEMAKQHDVIDLVRQSPRPPLLRKTYRRTLQKASWPVASSG